MAIYFYVYPSAFQNPGGGEIQLLKTKEYLEKRGLEILLYDQWNHRLRAGDLLHVFGSSKYCYGLMRTAKELGAAVVLSTICWYDWRSALMTYPNPAQRALNILRYVAKASVPWFPSLRKATMDVSDRLFPNSDAEADQLVRYFRIPRSKIRVIRNGVDPSYAQGNPSLFIDKFGVRDFFLCVGRIEPRKNQLALIRAHRGMDKPLVVIGTAVSRYLDYEARCREEAGPKVHFLGSLAPDSEILRAAYAACDTFVLPSWFETPGLAALEAALAGAKVVITQGGSAKEYFGEEVLYVDPSRIDKIRLQMERSASQPRNGRLRNRVHEQFLWDHVAESVVRCYEELR